MYIIYTNALWISVDNEIRHVPHALTLTCGSRGLAHKTMLVMSTIQTIRTDIFSATWRSSESTCNVGGTGPRTRLGVTFKPTLSYWWIIRLIFDVIANMLLKRWFPSHFDQIRKHQSAARKHEASGTGLTFSDINSGQWTGRARYALVSESASFTQKPEKSEAVRPMRSIDCARVEFSTPWSRPTGHLLH